MCSDGFIGRSISSNYLSICYSYQNINISQHIIILNELVVHVDHDTMKNKTY